MFKKFNIKNILAILGKILLVEAGFMASSIAWSLYYDETTVMPFIASVCILLFASLLCHLFAIGNKNKEVSPRDAYLTMVLSLVVVCLFGSLPYLLSEVTTSVTNALFETASGFSTTGATIFDNVEALPKSILWWRSLTHWMGGMGVLVLVVAILPFMKAASLHVFSSGNIGFGSEKLNPKAQATAHRLWAIYISLTCAEILLLWAGDMNLFESITHSFSTVSTGGFSVKNTSLAGYSAYSQYVVALFMLVSGINFVMIYYVLKGNLRRVWRNEELRLYSIVILVGVGVVSSALVAQSKLPLEPAFRAALFQVSSILSTTGLTTTNYTLWPSLGLATLFFMMFLGACSGSTGGGIKIIRHVLAFKTFKKIISQLYHPKAIITLSINDKKIEDNYALPIVGFILLYMLTFVAGSISLTACDVDLSTAMGATASALGGVGPGIGSVGPANSFASMPLIGKAILSTCMVVGRLELLPVFIIFSKGFWKN